MRPPPTASLGDGRRFVSPSRATARSRRSDSPGPSTHTKADIRSATARRPLETPSRTRTSGGSTVTTDPGPGSPLVHAIVDNEATSPTESGCRTLASSSGHQSNGWSQVASRSVDNDALLTPDATSNATSRAASVVLPDPLGPSRATSLTAPRRAGRAAISPTASSMPGSGSGIDRPAPREGPPEGDLVGVFEVATDRQPAGQSGHRQVGEGAQ